MVRIYSKIRELSVASEIFCKMSQGNNFLLRNLFFLNHYQSKAKSQIFVNKKYGYSTKLNQT